MEYSFRTNCSIENYANIKNIGLDFGEVEVGVTKIKSIKIVNQSSNKQSYVVQKDSLSNPLDCVFNALEYTWTLMPCESYVCDISYRPILPNRKCTDYFFVTDTSNCCYKIVVQGSSLGSQVTSSATRLIMVCENMQCRKQKCFKLTNHAKVGAKFMFDIDIAQCPFKINELSGVIKASSSKCFTVSFEPTGAGIFKYRLSCLVLHQTPLILELYGSLPCSPGQDYIKAFNSKIEMIEELDISDNFTNYLRDTTGVVKSNPPAISLSWNFMDFGQMQTGSENYVKRTPQTVCLTNHNIFNLLVIWEKDVSKTFSIQPQEAKVRSNQSIIFEIRFDPAEENTFYSRELIARTFRLPCCETSFNDIEAIQTSTVPDYVSLRLIGHTYSYGLNDCIPQYEIPETVIMPACIPATPVYTTFMIKNFCQQPLMFCFVPPDTSHYSIKPMMGLIGHKQEHQVIAVQLFPEAESDRAYVERWAVRLNGNPEYEIYIDLQGFAEQASLVFGDVNTVTLDPVHIGCRHTQSIPVRNPTRHCVRFEYSSSDFPKELSVQEISGIIHPNETVLHDWTFAPDRLGDSNFEISCRLRTDMSSRSTAVKVDVTGKCAEGSLIAIPEELNFGERAYKEVCESEFKMFNFSPVTINFSLICRPSKPLEIMNEPENDIEISPICGSISPGRGEKIKIVLTPTQPGFYELNIQYYVRSHLTADTVIPLIEPQNLCTLHCMCYLPTIQDLLYRAETNKQVSKVSLWKSLCIDDFNIALTNLLPYQETSVEMTIPFVDLNENEKFLIKLLVKNTKPIKSTLSLKQQSTCLCNDQKRKSRPRTKSTSKNGCLYCVHDHSCSIFPTKMTLSPGETGILTIDISSDTLQPSGIFWDLKIGEERYINWNIKLENQIILSGNYLNFKQINLKRLYMRYQTAWIYNDKECEASYTVDIKNLVMMNKKHYGIIFTCLNPQGILKKYERQPIIFGFCPNRFGIFKTTVLIKVNDIASILNIEAESTCTAREIDIEHDNCPLSDTFTTPEIEVYFNHNCVIASPISTHGKLIKLVMVHNHHPQDVLQYTWKNCEIPELVKINVNPTCGLIQPQTLLTFMIEIDVGSYECCLDIDLFCDFINVSERRLAEKKKSEEEKMLCQLKNEFTITDKGILLPKKPIFEETKKPSTFCKTLTLKIHTYDSESADDRVELHYQLKNTPNEEIARKLTTSNKSISANAANMSTHIFESMIWDIINSSSFSKTLKENLNNVHDLKYSQLPVDIGRRKNQAERTELVPPKRHVQDVLHTMICMVVHEEFNFDTAHFSHPTDIRQISYQKTYMEEHHHHRRHSKKMFMNKSMQ
ncbi:cilia- and flagella-associated protein 65-like isoform X2 [Nasonia vitripennis]|uniref:Uncharacterized protein n=1 Tax=Nasonia vitripennis TaxID=7425 RepID=A0A7M7H4L0_NASVI|nr:cilia- and flagella-associated protein 65-like isoform X2 [Nasonia vitripennis]